MTTEEKCLLALAHRGWAKHTLARLDAQEQAALAAIVDANQVPSLEFSTAFGGFWESHRARMAELKAVVDDPQPEEPTKADE